MPQSTILEKLMSRSSVPSPHGRAKRNPNLSNKHHSREEQLELLAKIKILRADNLTFSEIQERLNISRCKAWRLLNKVKRQGKE